jgi:hypothetical protein
MVVVAVDGDPSQGQSIRAPDFARHPTLLMSLIMTSPPLAALESARQFLQVVLSPAAVMAWRAEWTSMVFNLPQAVSLTASKSR